MNKTDLLLSTTKSIRSFIFITLSISVPFFLSALGIDPLFTSLILLFAMATSTFFIYLYTLLKIRIKAKLLLLGSLLFVATAFLFFEPTLPGLLAAIVIGAISFSGKDIATNQSLEQYTIGHATRTQRDKNLAFTLYNFLSYAAGTAASAFLFLVHDGYQNIFLIVLLASAFQVFLYLLISFPEQLVSHPAVKLQPEVKSRIRLLGSLFLVDSIGGGLVNTSIISLWFEVEYHITLSQAGLIFIGVNVITAISIIISGYISTSIGLVRTMVYTHITSNIFLFLVPVLHFLTWSEVLLFIRQTTSQMDVPARDSFVNTVIPEDSRIAGNSSFLAIRNVGQVPGPGIAGALFEFFPSGVFMAAALTKISYDLAFFLKFRKIRV